jgi:hypothetical protein
VVRAALGRDAVRRGRLRPTISVTPIRTDVTGVMRARRYRERQTAKRDSVTSGVTAVSTAAMCSLAARLSAGIATADDLWLADRLIMALVERLPPDSKIALTD